ncbi:3-oxoacyl-ACP synthase [Winogradskyella sp. J14-2]|uniref:3-oxoacyl-ACP synthase n=1 Tax=Winogradskyella sp. J14-2 TaxID=1936080 RepID=UPI000972A65E|nr:3-oxoacyl-ACP synthase [Winogradskyella sp. J14-2]APY08404.1 3-oxoacyl-ACP synthase [Winogradskyella sp. J14-2]
MSLKQNLYCKCEELLNQRLKVIQKTITDIQNSLLSETKSSAGDKHETGRAMLQLEREKAGQQLADIQKQFKLLHKINPEIETTIVTLGSIVFTSQANYFMAVSVGELKTNSQQFYAISPATPMGKLLVAKSKGDAIQFRNQEISILEVL